MTVQIVRPGNFTPPSRTPWGGTRIIRKYKAGLPQFEADAEARVGESWEISVEPSFPSMLATGELLSDAIAQKPVPWLGQEVAARCGGQSPLLVKLVDAAMDLSVQVHPPDDYALLGADESGKTEAWIILDAEPGARIYLGFRDGVSRAAVEQHLNEGKALDVLMNDVRVEPGQVFVIPSGTVHALGAGITVLEPQHVRPGRRAVTYRFWDWNRGYDENGEPDVNGRQRPLHISDALAVTDWDGSRGDAFVRACSRNPAPTTMSLFTRSRLVDEDQLFAEEWAGTGSAALPRPGSLLGVLCLAGSVTLVAGPQTLVVDAGYTAVIPAAVPHVLGSFDDSRIMFCAVPR